jgi:hypothetical protein
MGLLSQEAKAAFADRQANTGKSGSRYLNTKDLSEEGTRITFLGDQNHMIHGYGVWCDRKGGGKKMNLRTATKLSKDELAERANEVGAVAPNELQKEFYAFTIWNYAEEVIQIFEFTQTGLVNPIIEHLSDEEIEGNEEEYDMKVTKTKTGSSDRDVRYSATPLASGKRKQAAVKKQIQKAFDDLNDEGYDISELFNSEGDPFKPELA